MAYTSTLSDCQSYFSSTNDSRADEWDMYEDRQEAAFNQAKRELEVFLNRYLEDPGSSDIYRDDYAHFEQTLHILQTVPGKSGAGSSGNIKTAQGKAGTVLDNRGTTISPRAQTYLMLNRRRILRG